MVMDSMELLLQSWQRLLYLMGMRFLVNIKRLDILMAFLFIFRATKMLSPLAVSTALYNIIDTSVGVVPVTRVDPALDALTDEWKSKGNLPAVKAKAPKTEKDEGTSEKASTDAVNNSDDISAHGSGPHGSKLIEKSIYKGSIGQPQVYVPEKMKGLPVGVQIVGRLNDDEKVLSMMHIIDQALGERGFGPGASERW